MLAHGKKYDMCYGKLTMFREFKSNNKTKVTQLFLETTVSFCNEFKLNHKLAKSGDNNRK